MVLSVYKKAPGRPAKHHALNDLVAQAMTSEGIPVSNEPRFLFNQAMIERLAFCFSKSLF